MSTMPHRHGYDSGCGRALLRHPGQDPNGEHRGGDRSGGQESGHAPVHITLLGVDRGASRFRHGGIKQVGSHRRERMDAVVVTASKSDGLLPRQRPSASAGFRWWRHELAPARSRGVFACPSASVGVKVQASSKVRPKARRSDEDNRASEFEADRVLQLATPSTIARARN
jgi:hypothetical protein